MKKSAPKEKDTKGTAVPAAKNTSGYWQQKNLWLAGVCCALFAFLLYANTLGHDYTVDDGTVIQNNKITKKGIAAIPEIFTTSYRAGFWDRNEGLYRPLSVAMFAAEWQLAPENPAPGHWMNVILFALTVFILFQLLAAIFKEQSVLIPLFATLLFAVHPIHTEVVANIKSRDEILCTLFVLLTLKWLYGYLKSGQVLKLAAAALAFFLSFLSKENAITVMGVIPFFIWFFSDKTIQKNIAVSSVFLGVTALYLIMRFSILGEMKGSAEIQLINNSILGATSGLEQFGTAIAIMGRYLWLLLIPHPLVFDYSYNQIPVVSLFSAWALIALLVIGFLIFVAVKGVQKKSPVAFGLIFFAVTISLVSNLLFLIESTMAERFLYLPSVGICIAVSWAVLHYFKMSGHENEKGTMKLISSKRLPVILLSMVLIAYSGKTISRNSDWKNNLTLLATDVKSSPNSARIRYAYGSALLIEKALKEENTNTKNGYLDKSIAELQKGVSILPSYAEAWYHLGIAYKERGNPQAAVPAFEQARAYKEFKEADFFISSGLAYGQSGKYDQAIADFTKAISIDPNNPEAYNNKGLYFSEKGIIDSSVIYLDKAIAMKPGFYQAHYNKGNAIAKGGKFNEAIPHYMKALELKPGYTDALLNLGNCYAAMSDYKNALTWYRKVEEQEPMNHKVLVNIGITYKFLGDEANAAAYLQKAEKVKGGNP